MIATNASIGEPWSPEVVKAHEISILVIVGVFGTLSTILTGVSLKNGWEVLNGVRHINLFELAQNAF